MDLTQQQLQGYFNAWKDKYDPRLNDIETALKANQPIIDGLVSNTGQGAPIKQKTLGEAIAQQLVERKDEVDEFLKSRHNKLTLEIKDTMTTSFSLTGDPQHSYSTQPAISPGHLINFRDLIPTTKSPTGSFVQYTEGTVTNGFSFQTEGQPKTEQDYTWTEEKATSRYLAATSKFSKQLMFHLPFLQNTLTRQLLRDFYKIENDYFYTLAAASALGSNYTTATVDAEAVIDMIANQLAASFNPSFVIVDPTDWARILKTKPSDYSVPGGFSIDANGRVTIAGTQLIPAPWAASDHSLVIDRDEIERLETESLRIEFATQNEDDWKKNIICARIECFETLNIRRRESLIYLDHGNS